MRERFGRKIYDTEKSELLGTQMKGAFGDPKGFEEYFYRKGSEDYFIHARGGEASPYPEEVLLPLELSDAHEWMERVLGEARTRELIKEDDLAVKKAEERKAARAKKKAAAKKTTAKKTTTKTSTNKKSTKK